MARPSCCRRARRGITLRTAYTNANAPPASGPAGRCFASSAYRSPLRRAGGDRAGRRAPSLPLAGKVTLPDLGGRERTDDRGERGPGVTQLAGRILTLGRGRAQQLLETVAEVSRPVGPVHAGAARFLVSGERVTRVPYRVLGC